MKFINLTPHAVVISNGTMKITFEKDISTPVARIEQVIEEKTLDYEVAPGMVLSIPINAVTRSTVYNLPEPTEGVIYICSSMVATFVRRPDVVAPITDSSCERDINGRVLSVKGLQTFNEKSMKIEVPETTVELAADQKKELVFRNGRLAVK